MRIAQLVPTLLMGDAVGNNCLAIDRILREAGYDASLYAENIDARLPEGAAAHLSTMGRLGDNDILLYQQVTTFDHDIRSFGGQRVFQYHNVTPPTFYSDYDRKVAESCAKSLEQMRTLRDLPGLCWVDSDFNRRDLIDAGYACSIHTIPILVPFSDYDQPADAQIMERYDDDYVNFIFVGRVVPNKAHEDVIRTFAWYQRNINAKCRLFLVGNADFQPYVGRLMRYIRKLGVENVIFPGHISFSAVLAYYRVADIFLCMSRHEGFCVPLLEAMHFHIPVLALAATAVPSTLGGAGVLLEDNNPIAAALIVDRVVRDETLRKRIVAGQDERLEYFSMENIKRMILDDIRMLS